MWIFPDASVQEAILALETDTTIFPAGMTLRLYTNDLTPTKVTALADLTQLTNVEVPGYAATTPAFNGTPYRKQDGSWEDLGSITSFVAAGGPPPSAQIVYGWYLTNAGNTVLVAAGRFDAPFTFVQDGDGFALEPTIRASQVDGDNYNIFLDMEIE